MSFVHLEKHKAKLFTYKHKLDNFLLVIKTGHVMYISSVSKHPQSDED